MGDPQYQPAYLQIKTANASGVLASGADPQHISRFFTMAGDLDPDHEDVDSTLLGCTKIQTSNTDVLTGSAFGCPSFQIDIPCFHLDQATFSDDTKWNIPIFSHGKFQVGVKPSGKVDGGFTVAGRDTTEQNGTYKSHGQFNAREWYTNGDYVIFWNSASNASARWEMWPGDTANIKYGSATWETTQDASLYPWDADWDTPGDTVTKNASPGSYALKGDAYIRWPNAMGGVDVYHTSGQNPAAFGNASPKRRLTFKYSTPSGRLPVSAFFDYGDQITLPNSYQPRTAWGNLGIIMGGDDKGWEDGVFKGVPVYGGGYVGPCGIDPMEASTIATAGFFTGCSFPKGFFKNGVKMTPIQVTGGDALALLPYTNNCNPLVVEDPVYDPAYFFYTGDSSFIGTLGRRGRSASGGTITATFFTNLATTDPRSFFSLQRTAYDDIAKKDSVATGAWPLTPSDPRRLMLNHDPANVANKIHTFWDYDGAGSKSGTANAVTAFGITAGFAPDGWKSTDRLDFGDSGHSGDIAFYGDGTNDTATDWAFVQNLSHSCGDPHITPLFGPKYDL